MVEQIIEVKTPVNILAIRQDYESNIAELMKKREEMTNIYQSGFDGPITERFSGVPSSAKVVKAGNTVYRQYTTPENLEKIRNDNKLKSGRVPFARTGLNIKAYWNDLKGIFVTTTNHAPSEVGVPDNKNFVDVTLPEDLPLIKIEEGIFLIPKVGDLDIEIDIN